MLKKMTLCLGALALAAALSLSGGCAASAPELMTTAKTPGQYGNQLVRIMDNNTRGIWDDANRLFFLEHNLRLSPYVMP